MYIGTILISILFLLVISLIIYAWIEDKSFDYFFLLLFVVIIGSFMIGGIHKVEENDIKYPYNKNYKIEVYYMDGGTEIRYFNCEGWQEPFLQPTRGSACNLIVGNNTVRCVTRFKILDVKKYDK
jgi:hypothetical protein